MAGQMSPMGAGGAGMSEVVVASEFDYLAVMIPHHDEAIATARILQRGTGRQEMRTFAASIVETQSAEVEQMKAWLAAWYPRRDTRVVYQPMMRDLAGLTGDALDRAFLEDMIRHHLMAVMTSEWLIMRNLAVHAGVIPFAANIRDTQHAEMQMMSEWLRTWFGRPGSGALVVGDRAGQARVTMTVAETGGGAIGVYNTASTAVVSLSEGATRGGLLAIGDASGNPVAKMGVQDDRYGIVLTGPADLGPYIPSSGLPGSYLLGCAGGSGCGPKGGQE